ncbi:ARF guanine-nucleotide exchange factor GNL2 [Phalaenopsis equestris]|uniref:ARF guanine-nucleotide exchange factor GNL2 n=1 Tax=Phalaenopsis equestris TaxID=78828 RepID=UPI0009E36338|nr:ARF guanine-nucleotide exchange factor GNL2 [Phalaenopsis equestris]
MARPADEDDAGNRSPPACGGRVHRDRRLHELGISCALNTEVGMMLAVIRSPTDATAATTLPGGSETDSHNSLLVKSLQSFRSLIFHPLRGSWYSLDPMLYLSPFLDIIQSDDVTSASTNASLYAVLKIIRLEIFGELTAGAREAIHAVVLAITNCRLELTDPASEDSILLRILQLLVAVVRSKTSALLTDHAICTIVSSCFQIVQQSATRGDLLQHSAHQSMLDLIEAVYSRLPDMRFSDGGSTESSAEAEEKSLHFSYTAQCMIDIFYFLCSLLNVEEPAEAEAGDVSSNEEDQLFALLLINSVVELGRDSISHHPALLHIIQDDLFHHLIHYGTRCGLRIFSMICNIAFNLYHFFRRFLRLQLEAFFKFVLIKIAKGSYGSQLQEAAGVVSFCRQPNFIIEIYVNYDCDPIRHNVLEEIVRILCKTADSMSNPISSMQFQAFEGLLVIIHDIANGIEICEALSLDAYKIDDSEFKSFWLEHCDAHKDPESWVEFVRMRKMKKKKMMIAANHYNRNEKKGMDFLSISRLVPSPPDPKSIAYFFRYTPRLDKNKIGDYLGIPDGFNVKVLKEFTQTFEFEGVILDTALRTFLETFRLPGESQKIQRILETFSERYYEQQQQKCEIFTSKDVVFILCYSLIMLNTDQHNPQVKKKMTEEEFIKNNRAINGGMDLPREYLSELFHSISTNAITLHDSSSAVISELNSNFWANLIKQSTLAEPFIPCEKNHMLCREVFITISGISVATLFIIFEQTEDENMLQECIEGLFSIARIARYGLEDILDELLSCFCKLTTLLNPYAAAEEIIFSFSNEAKPKMATLAVFTIANKFGGSIRGAWRSMIDCLLKLKRLKLLPPTLIETSGCATEANIDDGGSRHSKSESGFGVIFPSCSPANDRPNVSGLVGRFTQLLSLETGADSMLNATSEMENNLKLIQQCRIDSIFMETARLPQESLQNLIRAILFAAAGKGQKFSTALEEEETVGFCWDLIFIIIKTNRHRFATFWMQFHESLALASQLPLLSPCPFAEKAMVALLRVAILLFSEPPRLQDRQLEEMLFKSINLIWKLDKDIVDACNESVAEATVKILSLYARSVQTVLGWKTLLHLLSVTGRHPENFDRAVETLVILMTETGLVTRNNYAFCIEAAFGFAALKISPVEKSSQILQLMADSVKWIIQWQKSSFNDSGSSNTYSNSSSTEENLRAATNLFMKLVEALRKTSLVRREEIRNQAVMALGRCFLDVADELEWTTGSHASSFNLVIFAMVDDLHEKMVEYSRREGMERETRSMEGTLKMALEQLVEVYLCFMLRLAADPGGFRIFWLGLLRRMDTCIKASLGEEGMPSPVMQELVPELLRRMILQMKEKEVLVQGDGSDLWEVTNIQIQWIAPSIKEELFPEDKSLNGSLIGTINANF